MNGWNFVIVGYSFVFVGLGVYTAYIIRRGRTLSKQLPPERRRFLG